MTIAATPRRAGPFTGNGVTDTFNFSFKIFAHADLVITQTDTAGIETVLVLNTDYTVSMNGDQNVSPGGSITTTDPLVADYLLTITSSVASSQTVTLTNLGGFYPASLNDLHDKMVALIQQVEERLDRIVTLPVSTEYTDITIPDPQAGYYLQWKTDLTGLQNVSAMSPTSYTVSAFFEALMDDANAAEVLDTLGITASVAEINRSDITTEGTVQASKNVTADSSGNVTNDTSSATHSYRFSNGVYTCGVYGGITGNFGAYDFTADRVIWYYTPSANYMNLGNGSTDVEINGVDATPRRVLLDTQTPSGGYITFDLSSYSGYSRYEFEVIDVGTGTSSYGQLFAEYYISGAWAATNYATLTSSASTGSLTQIPLTGTGLDYSGSNNQRAHGKIEMFPNSRGFMFSDLIYQNATVGENRAYSVRACHETSGVPTQVRFTTTLNDITGTIKLYGIK